MYGKSKQTFDIEQTYATGGFVNGAGLKPGEIPAIVWPEFTVSPELYAQALNRSKRKPPRYWYTRKIDHGTMIVCRLGREHDTDALELAHTLGADQLREHYDSRWLILNAIEGLERNAARLPVPTHTVMVQVSGHEEAVPPSVTERRFGFAMESLKETIGNIVHRTVESAVKGLAGGTWVLTGAFECGHRDQIKELIEKLGGRVAGAVNKDTCVVVEGSGLGAVSTKVTKARELGVAVISEATMVRILELAEAESKCCAGGPQWGHDWDCPELP